ncbi:MAG: ATP-grasp domain-containing protein [Candidatus Gracilibacteria bacterium]|nr:ATP-grasp domain-containing protein [Candidatus Gracilibacteria bacterium]
MSKFLINISRGYKMHDYYIVAYTDLYKNHNIKTLVFFDKNLSKNTEKHIESEAFDILYYDSMDDLKKQIIAINKSYVYYINTFDETLVLPLFELKKELGYTVSEHYEAFRNKNLQRELLLANYPDTSVEYFQIDIETDNSYEYFDKLSFPYVIKPIAGAQSSGVVLIHSKLELDNYLSNIRYLDQNMSDRGIKNIKYLIEEFIDGEMYTVNYFVNTIGEVFYSPIVKVNSSRKIGIDDFSNYVRINGKVIESEISFEDVKIFIEKNIKTFGIRDTFIHHEFKLTSKGVIKNIELNARIGGYRLEMIQNIYGFNLLTMPLKNNLYHNTSLSNAVFVFYPKTTGILKGFNEELLDQIKQLESYSSVRISSQKIGLKVGPTKDGYGSLVALRIKNDDINQFNKDYDFIEGKYNELIVLE